MSLFLDARFMGALNLDVAIGGQVHLDRRGRDAWTVDKQDVLVREGAEEVTRGRHCQQCLVQPFRVFREVLVCGGRRE